MATVHTYEAIRPELGTGDIVLFSGKGPISAGIKVGTRSRWSHVGMLIKLKEYDFLTLWESTTLRSVDDVVYKRPVSGVQLVPLSARLNSYTGVAAVRILQGVHFNDGQTRALMALRRNLSGRPYERSKIELIKAAYDGAFGANEEDLSSLFCSELVAEAYQNLGLLDGDTPSNEYTPADFSQDRDLPLLRGSLSDEVYLTA